MTERQSTATLASAAATPEACAREVMETVPQVMRAIRAEMRRHADPQLSVPQFRLLAYLGRSPGASLGDVAAHLGVTNPTASAMVERLVRRGLVERKAHPDERRRVALRLTALGSARLDQARRLTRQHLAGLLARLSDRQRLCLQEGLRALRGALGAGAGGRVES
ncbi:MAG: MarR family transcriptional regulator [Firmicutes bacterium]|nr:MarR family transcriptional regulator [Bacillota bacterium]